MSTARHGSTQRAWGSHVAEDLECSVCEVSHCPWPAHRGRGGRPIKARGRGTWMCGGKGAPVWQEAYSTVSMARGPWHKDKGNNPGVSYKQAGIRVPV